MRKGKVAVIAEYASATFVVEGEVTEVQCETARLMHITTKRVILIVQAAYYGFTFMSLEPLCE